MCLKRYVIYLIAFLYSFQIQFAGEDVEKNDIGIRLGFENGEVLFPAPSNVHLNPGGRFYSRIFGNQKYLLFQYEVFGEEMIDAFASRQYAPGKLLERMWDGEYAGKWLDAASRTAVNTRNDSLLSAVNSFAARLKEHQQPDGYMGIKPPADRELGAWEKSWDLWNQWNSMIGFLTHYESFGDESSLDAASAIADYVLKTYFPVTSEDAEFMDAEVTGGMTKVVIINQLVRLYRHTGNEKLIEFVEQVIEHYPPVKNMVDTGEPYLFHPYMLGAVLEGVVNYAAITSNEKMLANIEKVWERLSNEHMFPTGSLGEREDLDDNPIEDVPDGQLQETCATTEWIFFTMDLYELTGKVKYIEGLEKTIYNALIGAQSDDGMKWCYWMPLRYSKHFLHGPTRCCFWSGPRGIARIPQIIYSVVDSDINVNLYEPSELKLNAASGQVSILQESDFPSEGKSSLIVRTPEGWSGNINLRKPSWAENFSIKLPQNVISGLNPEGDYISVPLKGNGDYRIDIEFDIKFQLEKLGEGFFFRRGPEVLALDTRDNIDTWLGAQDDLITIPDGVELLELEPDKRYQWAGPLKADRRRYRVKVEDARTDELRSVILTPYADAGNDGAAFRTVFPPHAESSYPSDWEEE